MQVQCCYIFNISLAPVLKSTLASIASSALSVTRQLPYLLQNATRRRNREEKHEIRNIHFHHCECLQPWIVFTSVSFTICITSIVSASVGEWYSKDQYRALERSRWAQEPNFIEIEFLKQQCMDFVCNFLQVVDHYWKTVDNAMSIQRSLAWDIQRGKLAPVAK